MSTSGTAREDFRERARHDGLGLGTCPPIASDIAEAEPVESDDTEGDSSASEYYAKMVLADLRSIETSTERALEWSRVAGRFINRKRARDHIEAVRTNLDELTQLLDSGGND
jgi:hypothetical protein